MYLLLVGSIIVVVFSLSLTQFLFKKENIHAKKQQMSSAFIFPHHDLIIHKFPMFYSNISIHDKEKLKRIIFLAPNHFEQTEGRIKTKEEDYILSKDTVISIDTEFVKKLKDSNLIHLDEQVFINEHAVNLHLSSVSANFPKVKFVPILLTRNVPRSSLDLMIDFLSKNTSIEDTLFIVSTDFSHNLVYLEAEKRDAQTLSLILANDFESIRTLDDEYTDCPECLYVLFRILHEKEQIMPTVLFHGNSKEFMLIPDEAPTTSYFVISL